MEMMLDKKANLSDFLIGVQNRSLSNGDNYNINNVLAQELLMNVQHSGGSKSFAKETRALKMRSAVAGLWKLTTKTENHHQSWSFYNYMRSCRRTQCQPFYSHSSFEANRKVKKVWQVGVSWADRKWKTLLFWSVIFPWFYTTTKHFSIRVWQKVDFIQLAMTCSVAGQRRRSKALPKAKLAPKKGHAHWCSAAGLIHHQWNHYSWEVCSANQWDAPKTAMPTSWHQSTERAQFFSITMPNCMLHNQHFKSWMSWAAKFCLIHHIHSISCQPTITSSSILTTFCRENASTTSRMQKMLSNSSSNPEAQIFTLQE